MKKLLTLATTLFVFCFVHSQTTNSISQFDITWKLDKDYEYGQFANGDYWVKGPVTIVGIEPECTVTTGGDIINGSMINPPTQYVQGYDSRFLGDTYDSSLNVAYKLNEKNPLNVPVNSSLISSISLTDASSRIQLKSAAILTVISEAPPKGSYRPAYSGTDKTVKFNIEQLNYDILNTLEPVENTLNMEDVASYFERPWIDHLPGWAGSDCHPYDNMPYYGREISHQIGEAALMLHLNFSNSEKEKLLIGYTQFGIDMFGIIKSGGLVNWVNDGGIASGRKWPILFSGLILGDEEMRNIGKKSGDYLYENGHEAGNPPEDYIHFGEDDQTFFVKQADIDRVLEPNWLDITGEPYLQSDMGLAEWGIRHSTYPWIDNKNWITSNYRRCCTAIAWSGFVLAAHIMDATELWNHDALFAYMDRYMEVEEEWRSGGFCENMWNNYRYTYKSNYTNTLKIDYTNQNVTAYPNPFFIERDQKITFRGFNNPGTLLIYSSNGQLIDILQNKTSGQLDWSVEQSSEFYSSGICFFHFVDIEGNQYNGKLLIK